MGDNGYNEVGDDLEYELYGRGVSSGSCARLTSRSRQQTKFYADYGNDNDNDSSDEGESNDGEEEDLDDTTGVGDELGDNDIAMDEDNELHGGGVSSGHGVSNQIPTKR